MNRSADWLHQAHADLDQAQLGKAWTGVQAARVPSLERVAVFGSYGRGTAAVGSGLIKACCAIQERHSAQLIGPTPPCPLW